MNPNFDPLTGPAAPVLRAIAGFLWNLAKPEEVILFGSQARGTVHAGSDADILVILTPNTTRQARDALAREELEFNRTAGFDIELQRFALTGEELCEHLRRGSPPFATRAMEEGVMCLDRLIVLSEEQLRALLSEFVAYYNYDRTHRTSG